MSFAQICFAVFTILSCKINYRRGLRFETNLYSTKSCRIFSRRFPRRRNLRRMPRAARRGRAREEPSLGCSATGNTLTPRSTIRVFSLSLMTHHPMEAMLMSRPKVYLNISPPDKRYPQALLGDTLRVNLITATCHTPIWQDSPLIIYFIL